MDTSEVKKCRRDAEQEILDTLKHLETVTAMEVRSVSLFCRPTPGCSSSVINVSVDMELGRP